jgi:hypothetical protein
LGDFRERPGLAAHAGEAQLHRTFTSSLECFQKRCDAGHFQVGQGVHVDHHDWSCTSPQQSEEDGPQIGR